MDMISQSHEWNLLMNLLSEDTISEIETNAPDSIWLVEKGKRKRVTQINFENGEKYLKSIEEGLIPHVKAADPYVKNQTDYLFEGSLQYIANKKSIRGRCHIALPPICDYPHITIAKTDTTLVTIEEITSKGTMSFEMMNFLKAAVDAKLSFAISGKTGAGKTTMLQALAKLIPSNVRVGVAEDVPELVLDQNNVLYQHSVPWKPGMDTNKVATLSFVVRQFLRQRIDRVIVGETRGPEFADFLTAANSGMEGSMTTIHANSPNRCLDKMSSFALKGSDRQPIRSVNMDIANSIDLIIQLSKNEDTGAHRVDSIQEISETVNPGEDASIATKILYKYNQEDDSFEKCGQMSDSMRRKMSIAKIKVDTFLKTPMHTRTPALNNDGIKREPDFPNLRNLMR